MWHKNPKGMKMLLFCKLFTCIINDNIHDKARKLKDHIMYYVLSIPNNSLTKKIYIITGSNTTMLHYK